MYVDEPGLGNGAINSGINGGDSLCVCGQDRETE